MKKMIKNYDPIYNKWIMANSDFHVLNLTHFLTFSLYISLEFFFNSSDIILHAAHLLLMQQLGRVKRIWYLSPMRAAKVQASLRIRTVSPEPPLLAHTSSESRGTFRQKARSLATLNGWACAVTICHDGMLEDTNSLDAAQLMSESV